MTRMPKARHRRATVAISMVIALVIVDLIIISVVIGGARDHNLTVQPDSLDVTMPDHVIEQLKSLGYVE